MAEDDASRKHLDLSQEYLDSATAALGLGLLAPARFNTLHALELAVKAAIHSTTRNIPRTHNVGGEFGKLFRDRVGSETTRRVNRMLQDYDGPRYPDWEVPTRSVVEADLAFVSTFVETIRALVEANP